MIAFVRGKFVQKQPALVVVDVNGVGYECHISLNTFSVISNADEGQLFTYLHITENAQTLYGFADVLEKTTFLQLISVSGVGAATARIMLSGMRPAEIAKAIVQGNVKQLESIKGIGKKTAERLIVELKDKLSKQTTDLGFATSITGSTIEYDAVQALMALGIAKANAENAVKKSLPAISGDVTLEPLIKLALKNL
jgi:Holliday junction DNA helicase RuvA